MQSDGINKAMGRGREAFHSALAATLEQARGALAAQLADETQEAAELGALGAAHIDAARFTSLLAKRRTVDANAIGRMKAAFEVLAESAGRAREPFEAVVEPGARLYDTVADALASIGRAFGAARVFELARTGHWREAEHGGWLDAFRFGHWNAAERAVAPPLGVTVNGRDAVCASGLAEFLDGAFKIILVVRGDAPPAPLARLVTPGTFVIQADDAAALDGFAAWEGPGIAAMVPESSARFCHDPQQGGDPWDRISVDYLPQEVPAVFLGGQSAAQQRDEVALLEALAKRPSVVEAPPVETAVVEVAVAPAGNPADKLATWLLSNAELGDL